LKSFTVATKWKELTLGCKQVFLSSGQLRTRGAKFGEYPPPETSAWTSHRLSSIADCSDCPIIGPDYECCRLISQALVPLLKNIFKIFLLICLRFYLQVIPVAVGIVVVAVSAVVINFVFFGGKKKKSPVTLIESDVKYPLKLVDKEVRSMYNDKINKLQFI